MNKYAKKKIQIEITQVNNGYTIETSYGDSTWPDINVFDSLPGAQIWLSDLLTSKFEKKPNVQSGPDGKYFNDLDEICQQE